MKNSTATILIIVAIGVFYTFTNPQYKTVQNLRVEADEYKQVLDGAAAIQDTSVEVEDKYREIPKVEVERLGKVLPDNIDGVRLALDLDAMAGQYGVSIQDVEVDRQLDDNSGAIAVDDGSPYDKVTVTFTVLSSYPNFTRFLADLEKSLRLTNVRTIYFQPNDAGIYEHKISVETYWLK